MAKTPVTDEINPITPYERLENAFEADNPDKMTIQKWNVQVNEYTVFMETTTALPPQKIIEILKRNGGGEFQVIYRKNGKISSRHQIIVETPVIKERDESKTLNGLDGNSQLLDMLLKQNQEILKTLQDLRKPPPEDRKTIISEIKELAGVLMPQNSIIKPEQVFDIFSKGLTFARDVQLNGLQKTETSIEEKEKPGLFDKALEKILDKVTDKILDKKENKENEMSEEEKLISKIRYCIQNNLSQEEALRLFEVEHQDIILEIKKRSRTELEDKLPKIASYLGLNAGETLFLKQLGDYVKRTQGQ